MNHHHGYDRSNPHAPAPSTSSGSSSRTYPPEDFFKRENLGKLNKEIEKWNNRKSSSLVGEYYDEGDKSENSSDDSDDNDEEASETEDEESQFIKLAGILGSHKKTLKRLQKKQEKKTRQQTVEMEDMVLRHKESLKALRRRHAREINTMEDDNERERQNKMNANQNELNSISKQLEESKQLISRASKTMFTNMKRKFEKEDEVVPECPLCMGEMVPPKLIYQCSEGHLVCSECRPKVNHKGCATCRNQDGYSSRCRYLEDLVRKRMHSS